MNKILNSVGLNRFKEIFKICDGKVSLSTVTQMKFYAEDCMLRWSKM